MKLEIRHIVLVANTAWSMYNFRRGVLAALLARGVRITVLAPHDESVAALQALGCQVEHLPLSAKGVNPLQDGLLLLHLWRAYRRLRPDFIIHYTIKPNIYGSVAARLAGIPSLAITTGLGYTFVNANLVARLAKQLYRFAFRFPREVWFLNEDDRQAFLQRGLVASGKAVLLHGEGVDLAHFAPRPAPARDGKARFLLIARMLWDKGVGEYVAAARQIRQQHPDAVFQLLGECGVANPSAISRAQLQAWQDEGVVDYLGTTDDVRPFIASADCVVLPSYREGIPRTLIEAAAMGKPLIASDAPGCRDVVTPGVTGWLVPVQDSVALARACSEMLGMPVQERGVMGAAGRALMQQAFDEQVVIARYLQFLRAG